MQSPEQATVLAWHDALNSGDVERVVSLATDDVEVGGPKGSGRSADLLRDWVSHAGIRLEPGRLFQQGDVVVVEQRAQWRAADGTLGELQPAATVFRLRDGRITSILRYPDLTTALASVSLADLDVPPGTIHQARADEL
jgi:ketosteroid isomerase-like protein